jgi:hypothetical protein
MRHANVTVYPSAAVLPQNLLRLHVFFDEPPFVDGLMQAVRLFDGNGGEVAHPFLDLPEGLWDSTGTRLTLLLHPGRIKSGLAAHSALGSAVQAGQSYRLELDLGLLAGGRAPGEQVQVSAFSVTKPISSAVDVAAWGTNRPTVGTLEPLHVMFDRSLDRLGLEQAFAVHAPDGHCLPFTLCVGAAETAARLTPLQPWTPGLHRIHLSADLEDVAGNRVAAKFEQVNAAQTSRSKCTRLVTFVSSLAK